VELGLFLLACGRIAKAIRASSGQRIFAFFGGNPWFLAVVKMLKRQTGLPLDIYLVDDLEESCRLNGQPILARWVRWFEPKVLRQADRVFVISPGYGEHLRSKYGIAAEWLPIPFRVQQLEYRPYKTDNPDVRTVAYIGGINALYLSALKEFLEVVAQWNKKSGSFKIKVLLLSYSEPMWVEKELAGFSDWELRHRASAKERRQALEGCWAVFLPYSFEETVRVMVSTSFPSRLSECMTAGRPLLVYGPSCATLSRYFVENGLSLCVQSKSGLEGALGQIGQLDSEAMIKGYESVLERYHSRDAVHSVLTNSVR
jgi:glycosyltransferase involved in cell wall biosynthesis